MENLIEKTSEFVRQQLFGAESGHDFQHILRVYNMAHKIAAEFQVNMMVVDLAALLHDIADTKFHEGDEDAGSLKARKFLESQAVPENTISEVEYIIRHMSFRHSFGFDQDTSTEFKIVQDADRLDAIGAIGIARAFSYGGYKKRPFYDPEIQPQQYLSGNAYQSGASPTINHFYEKLLLLKDQMNTEPARRIAEKRHNYLLGFLQQFDEELKGL